MFCENHFSRAVWRGAVVLVVVWLGLGYGLRGAAQPATPRLNLSTAAGATELPVGPWGSYSARHAGPCYLASRRLAPLFAFPIVVSQERDELLPIGSRATDGKVRLRPERVTILRRAAGLSPAGAAGDAAGRPPTARIVDADSYGYLTSARITFPEAALTQDVSKRRDAAGNPLAPAKWPASTAMVAWSAAFADNGAEGLVVRIALSNPGAAAQRFCVDLSGGLDRPDPLFAVSDFSIEADPEGRGLPFKHKKLETWLAITAQQGDYSTHFYGASEEVFAANASICPRDTSGAALLAPAAAAGPRAWALTRLSRITVEAGETRTIALSIGLGRDSEGALVSARTLLAAAEERKDGPPRVSLFAAAEKAHEAARYNSGSAALDGLMAQSLTNIPFHDLRRVGVVSRESTPYYQPGVGGWMALGWGVARPDWSAAQLNAWFLTQSPPQKVIRRAIAVPPTDIFVLWDLVQRTHNKDLAEKFYPYAVWRFREFLESGREREDDWLFTWPSQRPIGATQPGLSAAATRTPEYSPEYSAYVLLAARSLLACARTLEKSAEEQATFQHAIDNAYSAMSKELWDPARGRFLFKPVPSAEVATVADRPERSGGDRLESILPFVAGQEVLTPDQDAALRTHLGDTATYLSPFGLRSESAKSSTYRAGDPSHGGIRFGMQWLFWKSLLDRGDGARAADLASGVLSAYEKAVAASGGYPEWLNGETGAAEGRLDSTGDSCATIALHAAYHHVGAVSCGWEVIVLDDLYDRAADTLKVVFRPLARQPKGVLLCVMGKPGAKYRATGGIAGDFTADAGGVLTLPMSNDKTTQQILIMPAGTGN